jgi:CRISPR-associated protein Csm4
MNALTFTLRPLTPFGTPLAGDTLFGQLCWALALRRGEEALERALEGYTEGRPFAVLSDAFPESLLPRPTLPDAAAGLPDADPKLRKVLRRRRWLPAEDAGLPLARWLERAVDAGGARDAVRTQNTINRLTGTTGRGPFAPRQVEHTEFVPGTLLEVHAVHDPARLPADDLHGLLDDIGALGFGRDASTGLGKFEVVGRRDRPQAAAARHAMALAPSAPDAAALDAEGCWWLPLTRFGRHGGTAALGGGGGPFKRPILLVRTGAVLRWREPRAALFHGTGLGGPSSPLSAVVPGTVHQGYAPLQPLNLEPAA